MELGEYSELKSINNPWTKTFIYALPMLDSHRSKFVNIQNCFLRNVDYPEYLDHLFPVFKEEEKQAYQRMLDKYRKKEYYVFDYKLDKVHRTFCFTIPGQYQYEFDKFKDSRYSEFTDEYKDRILSFHDKRYKSDVAKYLWRDESKFKQREEDLNVSIPRENEIISVLNPQKETLTHDLKINYEYKKQT